MPRSLAEILAHARSSMRDSTTSAGLRSAASSVPPSSGTPIDSATAHAAYGASVRSPTGQTLRQTDT
jgi:hypothetical protein